jgi:hypothetical protein
LKHFLPREGGFFESRVEQCDSLRFPVLQPLLLRTPRKNSLGVYVDTQLTRWTESPAAIVIRVRFQDFLNTLPGFEQTLGEVVFPFEKVVEAGKITGWFEVLRVGSCDVSPCLLEDEIEQTKEQPAEDVSMSIRPPLIFATLKWIPPQADEGLEIDQSERLASHSIQQEFVRATALSRDRKSDFLESSLGAVNTALGRSDQVTDVPCLNSLTFIPSPRLQESGKMHN